ncbi:MAG: hypothetical protein IAF08_16980 [Rhizobacter sp.]|nr:hypothetical protein [Chlorobiales bacterium]
MERLSELKLLRYLDPYGDATFNHLQMDDLIKDLDDLENIEHNPLTAEIQKLAARCKSEVHTYLTFYGD